jgi:hypothetical protein
VVGEECEKRGEERVVWWVMSVRGEERVVWWVTSVRGEEKRGWCSGRGV